MKPLIRSLMQKTGTLLNLRRWIVIFHLQWKTGPTRLKSIGGDYMNPTFRST